MKYYLLACLIILVIILAIYFINKKEGYFNQLDRHSNNTPYIYPELPPLNYNLDQEPGYFWYVPIVNDETATGKNPKFPESNFNENINEVFGVNNYVKYYPETTETDPK